MQSPWDDAFLRAVVEPLRWHEAAHELDWTRYVVVGAAPLIEALEAEARHLAGPHPPWLPTPGWSDLERTPLHVLVRRPDGTRLLLGPLRPTDVTDVQVGAVELALLAARA